MKQAFSYFIFNKPFQVLSQFSPEGDKQSLAEFFPGIEKDIYPVGRLDYDSEGLLLLTNDKKLNHRLLDPKYAHQREYWAQVEGVPREEDLQKLKTGVFISTKGKRFKTKPAEATLQLAPELPERNPPIRFRKNIPTTWISLALCEGKNRQVRKMTAAIGFPTLRLLRYRIGKITLGNMKPGEILQLSENAISDLF